VSQEEPLIQLLGIGTLHDLEVRLDNAAGSRHSGFSGSSRLGGNYCATGYWVILPITSFLNEDLLAKAGVDVYWEARSTTTAEL
jgi:hypothetical protein